MENDKKLFLKNFVWNILGTGFNSFNSLFFLIIVTRINGQTEAGVFSIAFAVALTLYTIAYYSGRLMQVTDTKNIVSDKDYIGNRILTCVVTMAIAVVFAICIKGYRDEKLFACIMLCLYKVTEAFAEVLDGIMQKNELLYKSGQSLFAKSFIGILTFTVTDIITKNLIISIISAIIVNVIIIICFDIIVSHKLIKSDDRYNFNHIIGILKTDFFVFANSFAGIYVLNAPKYSIDKYGNDDMQAMFGYIIMPATVIVLFAQFFLMPFLNKLRMLYGDRKMKEFIRLSNMIKLAVFLFGIIVVVCGYLIGPEILKIIYGVDDIPKYRLHLAVILMAYICYGISYVNLITLTTVRKTFIQFVIYLITMAIAFAGSNILVEHYLIKGAAASCVITLGMQFVMYTVATKAILYKICRENKNETYS